MTIDRTRDVSQWWSGNPQTYGDLHGKAMYEGAGTGAPSPTQAFFDEADRHFFEWNHPLHATTPFDRLFPYERFRGRRVLEIGCGMGAMASLWAKSGAQVNAVDLAPFSVEMTRKRFELAGLTGDIREADGRTLPFETATFDYVYSWGVLHHSPDLERSLREMLRVLKPGGEFGLMLYHRRSFLYAWRIAYREGFLHDERTYLNPVELSSRYTDASEAEGNPHTWPVTKREVRTTMAPLSSDLKFRVLGTEIGDIFGFMVPGLDRLPGWILKPWARRYGWSLWCSGTRA